MAPWRSARGLELAASARGSCLAACTPPIVGQVYAIIGDYSRAAEVLRGNVEALARSTPCDMRVRCIKSQAWLAEVLR